MNRLEGRSLGRGRDGSQVRGLRIERKKVANGGAKSVCRLTDLCLVCVRVKVVESECFLNRSV